MKPGLRLALLVGCVAVAALVSPTSARVVLEDLVGPHALRPETSCEFAADGAGIASSESSPEDSEEIARNVVDLEAGHDAP